MGFGAVNWGSYASPDPVQALLSSGSSLSTVGFATPPNVQGQIIAFVEGGIGLFIVVFLLTFRPEEYLTARQVRGDRVAGIYARGRAGRRRACGLGGLVLPRGQGRRPRRLCIPLGALDRDAGGDPLAIAR